MGKIGQFLESFLFLRLEFLSSFLGRNDSVLYSLGNVFCIHWETLSRLSNKHEINAQHVLPMSLIVIFYIPLYAHLYDLSNKHILINFSAYPTYRLAHNLLDFSSSPFISAAFGTHINDICRIEADGFDYRIAVGEEYLCADMSRVVACTATPMLWQIMETSLGVFIKSENLCVTYRDGLELSDCESKKDQLFHLQLLPGKCPDGSPNKEDYEDENEMLSLRESADPIKETFDQFLERKLPALEDHPPMKEIVKKLWDKTKKNGGKKSKFGWGSWLNLFC